jgi:hypothetical protein
VAVHLGPFDDLLAAQSRGVVRAGPVQVAYAGRPLLEADGVCRDELVVERVPLQQQAADRLERGQVSAKSDRQVQVRQRRTVTDRAAGLLRVLEPDQPGLAQRVDRQDLGAARFGLLQRTEHAGVVGARVLPGHHDQLGAVQV